MRIRRSLTIVVLVGALLASSATPARAVYPDVERWRFTVLSQQILLVTFWISGAYAPPRAQAEGDPVLDACTKDRSVKLQYKKDDGWSTIASGKTNDDGRFKSKENNRSGLYRVNFPESTGEGGVQCYEGTSKAKKYEK